MESDGWLVGCCDWEEGGELADDNINMLCIRKGSLSRVLAVGKKFYVSFQDVHVIPLVTS